MEIRNASSDDHRSTDLHRRVNIVSQIWGYEGYRQHFLILSAVNKHKYPNKTFPLGRLQ